MQQKTAELFYADMLQTLLSAGAGLKQVQFSADFVVMAPNISKLIKLFCSQQKRGDPFLKFIKNS